MFPIFSLLFSEPLSVSKKCIDKTCRFDSSFDVVQVLNIFKYLKIRGYDFDYNYIKSIKTNDPLIEYLIKYF